MKILFLHNSSTGCCLYVNKLIQSYIKQNLPGSEFQSVHFHTILNRFKKTGELQIPDFDVCVFGTWADCLDLSRPSLDLFKVLENHSYFNEKVLAGFITHGGAAHSSTDSFKTFVQ